MQDEVAISSNVHWIKADELVLDGATVNLRFGGVRSSTIK